MPEASPGENTTNFQATADSYHPYKYEKDQIKYDS